MVPWQGAANGVATFQADYAIRANAVTAVQTGALPNFSTAGTLTVTRDSTLPSAPVVTLAAADDTGVTGDNITNEASVTISVAAESGSSENGRASSREGEEATASNGGANVNGALAGGGQRCCYFPSRLRHTS